MDLFDTRTMLQVLEQIKEPRTFLLDTFFSAVEVSDTEVVDIDIVKGKRRLAPFVNPKHEGKVIERVGWQTKTFRPPYIKPKMVCDAEDILHRMPGDHVYEGVASPQEFAMRKLANDLAEMQAMATRREEWMAAQMLDGGVVEVSGEGFDGSIDFGMDSNHKITLTSGDRWSESTATPIEDFRNWRRQIAKSSGMSANVAILGEDVVDALLNSDQVHDQLDSRRVDMGMIRPQELPNGVTYLGSLHGGALDLYGYDEWYIDESTGNEMPMVPAKKLFLGSTSARTARHYGAIRDVEFPGGAAPVRWFPKSWVQKDPSARFVMVQSAPLPVMHQVDAFIVATVLS